MAALELADPAVNQVQELAAVTEASHSADHKDFHQVALEAALELDPPTSAPSTCLEVPDSVVTLARQEASTTAPLM